MFFLQISSVLFKVANFSLLIRQHAGHVESDDCECESEGSQTKKDSEDRSKDSRILLLFLFFLFCGFSFFLNFFQVKEDAIGWHFSGNIWNSKPLQLMEKQLIKLCPIWKLAVCAKLNFGGTQSPEWGKGNRLG